MVITAEMGPPGDSEGIGSVTLDPTSSLEIVSSVKNSIREQIHNGCSTIEIDLHTVDRVSSDLITLLLWSQMECSRANVRLRLRHVTPENVRIFRFAGLNQLIEIDQQ